MPVLTISLPDEQRAYVEAAVASGQYASLDDFFTALVSDAQVRDNSEQIEALLLEADEETDEPIAGGPEFWLKMHQDLDEFVRIEGLK